MKNLITILIITLLTITFTNTVYSQEKSFDDFRGLEWGEPIFGDNMVQVNNASVELILQKKEFNKSYYTVENENLTIGTAELELIYYIFNSDGEFYGLEIIGKPESKDDMVFIMENKFGKSPVYTKNGEVKYRKWKAEEGVVIYLYENEKDDYILSIKNKSLDNDFYEINENVDDF